MGFGGAMTEIGFGNQLELSPEEIFTNIQTVQERYEIELVELGEDTIVDC
ncbi:MAG: hypothetical protein RLZZ435_765 [Cyanobacteriota bacterium]|jgi:hypothetical protein